MRSGLGKIAAGVAVIIAMAFLPLRGAKAAAVPPSLRGLSISPASASITNADAVFTFKLTVLSVAPVTSGCIALQDPTAPDAPGSCFTSSDLVSGTATNGVFQTKITVHRYAHAGIWSVAAVTLTDSDGDKVGYANADLVALSSQYRIAYQVTVTGTSDTNAPSLASLDVAPSSGDLGVGPVNVVFTAHITDNLSGFQSGCLDLGSPSQPTVGSDAVCFVEPSDRVSGTPVDGIYQHTLVFDPGTETGAWPLLDINLQDGVYNAKRLSSNALVAAGAPAAVTLTNSTATVPDPPTNVSAVAGVRSATVTWSAPTSTGGSTILNYTVTASPGGQTTTVASSQTTATVANLIGDTSYTFTVHATNSLGSSAESTPSDPTTLPPAPPAAPSSVTATAGAGQATISWTPPPDEGSAITGYTILTHPGTQATTVTGNPTSATVSGLIGGGDSYTFSVYATNALGGGVESASSNSVSITVGLPDKPTTVIATDSGNGTVALSWNPPNNDGGSAITNYTITYGTDSQLTVPANETSITVTGLTVGWSYQFVVSAANTIGSGPASYSNGITLFPESVPDPPTGVTATAGDGDATVSWNAPCCAVLAYGITVMPGGRIIGVQPTQTTATVSGLTNGTTYTFAVSASNELGASPLSTPSNAVTPEPAAPPPPLPPTSIIASPGDGQATISWTAPTNAPVDSYTITSSPSAAQLTVPGDQGAALITGLTNGTTYTFTVHATNSSGTSPESSLSNAVTPAGSPAPPTDVQAVSGDAVAIVVWTAPATDSGNAITNYTITASPGGATTTVDGSQTGAYIADLTNGTAYTFTVHATNAIGNSAESAPSNAITPAGAPDAPTNVHATAANHIALVRWSAPDDHGSPIDRYTITTSPPTTVTSVSSSHTSTLVSGLTDGLTYTFTVTATNAIGDGPPSSPSNATTPSGPPNAPTQIHASLTNGTVTITWAASTSNGAPVTTYTVAASPSAKTLTVAATPTRATFTHLAAGSYTFHVRATNAVGLSGWSFSSNSITIVAPQSTLAYAAHYTTAQYAYMIKTAAHFHLAVQDVPKTGVAVVAFILKISKHPPTKPIGHVNSTGPDTIVTTYTAAQSASTLEPVAKYIVENGNDTLYIGGLLMEYFAAVAGVH